MHTELPIVTIITSTFNAGKELPYTINSIKGQTYENIQWIIADGGSSDNTINLIKKNLDIIDVWFSETDKGIYDAWNKACKYIKGEWIIFIGAGDELFSPNTIKDVVAYIVKYRDFHEIVYGNLLYISESNREPLELIERPWTNIKGKWEGFLPVLPIHPSVFHHISLFNGNNTFDLNYGLVSDALFVLESLIRKEPLYIPITIDKMPLGGATGEVTSFLKTEPFLLKINRKLKINIPWWVLFRAYFKFYLKTILYYVFGPKYIKYALDIGRVIMGRKRKWSVTK